MTQHNTSGYCYVFEGASAYKFGFSADPWLRLRTLRTGNSEPVEMIGYASGSRLQEARLHELLHRFNVGGEWYRKCETTKRIANLFPKVSYERKAKSRGAKRAELNEFAAHKVRSILEDMGVIGEKVIDLIPAVAEESGLGRRRIKAFWYGEAKMIMPAEIEALECARSARLIRRAVAGEG